MGPGFDFCLDDFEARISADIRLVMLTRPHSPTGLMLADDDIRRVCRAAGPDRLVVLDEAYIHFSQTPGGIGLLAEQANLIVLRTFSKAYGLAGLRLGFGIAERGIIRPMLALKPTWNMGQLQIAGGIAALDDTAHVERTVSLIVEMRGYVQERLRALNAFRMIEGSGANFFLLEILDEAMNSTRVFQDLLARGVIVKDCSVSFRGLGKRYLRVDVSLKKHMDRLVDALSDLQGSAF
jgi:histidinol-phosphate aminotransferase